MTCRATHRLLSLFAGGDLKASRRNAVADHVAACAACRAEVDAFAAVRSLLPLSSLSFREEERAAVRRRVLDEIAKRRGRPSPFFAFVLRPRFALAAVAGAVVLAASLLSPFFAKDAGEPAAVVAARPTPSATPVPAAEHVAERIAETAPPPADRVSAIARAPRTKREPRPPVPASEEPSPTVRFEIQTGNVNVRIIWFAGGNSAGEASSGPAGDSNGIS